MKKRGKYIAHRKRHSGKPVVFLVAILFLILTCAFYFLWEDNQKISEPLLLVENDSPEDRIANFKPIIVTIPENFQTTEEEPSSMPETILGDTEVTRISVLESLYNQEQAMIDGCVVMQDGDLCENQANWQHFVEASHSGEPASVTVIHYTRDESGSWYIPYEVSFDGDLYLLKIGEQLSYTFTELEMTTGELNHPLEPYDRYIRYTLTGGTWMEDVIIVEDLISTPIMTNISGIALHLKQGEPPIIMYDDPTEVETILNLLKDAEYQLVPPKGYILGVKLILHTQDGQEVILEVDIIQGIYRYGNQYGYQYYHYGELTDLFSVLAISQWPDAVMQEYNMYLYAE